MGYTHERKERNHKRSSAPPQAEPVGANAVSDTSKRLTRKPASRTKPKAAAKPTAKRPPASIRLPMHPLEVALIDLRIEYLSEQAERLRFRRPKTRADVIRSLLQSTIETRGLGFPREGPWHDRLVATVRKYGIPADWSPVAAKRARDA
jgi:hypothetical protein